ncbi:hypothetical protein GFS60_07020 (plasmid) [Rhodococcus sp. WAY2]|nr:hypothetical protein GFS60_07020 [Rhodococcus sp. WAY2]
MHSRKADGSIPLSNPENVSAVVSRRTGNRAERGTERL